MIVYFSTMDLLLEGGNGSSHATPRWGQWASRHLRCTSHQRIPRCLDTLGPYRGGCRL